MWYHSQGMWKKKYFHYTISIAIGMSLGHVYLFIFLKRLLSLLFLLFSLSDYASRAMPNRRTVTYQLRSREWEGPTVWTVSSVCVWDHYMVVCCFVHVRVFWSPALRCLCHIKGLCVCVCGGRSQWITGAQLSSHDAKSPRAVTFSVCGCSDFVLYHQIMLFCLFISGLCGTHQRSYLVKEVTHPSRKMSPWNIWSHCVSLSGLDPIKGIQKFSLSCLLSM